MTEPKPHKSTGAWKKAAFIGSLIVAFLLLITGGLRYSLTTNRVMNYAARYVEQAAGDNLNGELQIGRISGDLGNRFVVHDIYITNRRDTLAAIDSLVADIELRSLLGDYFTIEEIGVHQPKIYVEQTENGGWNWTELIARESGPASTEDRSPFALRVATASLNNGSVNIKARELPRENVQIKNIQAAGGYRQDEDNFESRLDSLSLIIDDRPVEQAGLRAAGVAGDSAITLKQLVLATGSTLMEAAGSYNLQTGEIGSHFLFDPLSWQNIADYAGSTAIKQDIILQTTISGLWPELNIDLHAQTAGIDSLRWTTRLRYDTLLTIKQSELMAKGINGELLTGHSEAPEIGEIYIGVDGIVPPQNPLEATLNGNMRAHRIQSGPYSLDSFQGETRWEDESLSGSAIISRGRENWNAHFSAGNVMKLDSTVHWKAVLEGDNIDPAYWMQDSTLYTKLDFRTEVTGRGFELSQNPWSYSMKLSDVQVGEQTLKQATASGTINRERINMEGNISIDLSAIAFSGNIADFESTPAYNLDVSTGNLDLSEIHLLRQLPTDITGGIELTGRGIDLADLQLQTTIHADSSLINGELLRNFKASISIEDSVATVSEMQLASSIAEGDMQARQNLLRYYDSDNRLNFEVNLFDVEPLSPLIAFADIKAFGKISGTLKPNKSNELELKSNLDLRDIQIDENILIPKITGDLQGIISRESTGNISLHLEQPQVAGLPLNNIDLQLEARQDNRAVKGDISWQINQSGVAEIKQQGTFYVTTDSVLVTTNMLTLSDNGYSLQLQTPFITRHTPYGISMDTLTLAEGSTRIQAAIPILKNDDIELFAAAENLKIGSLLQAISKEEYVDGTLNGELFLGKKDDEMLAKATSSLTGFTFEDAIQLDSISTGFSIEDARFDAQMEIHNNDQLLSTGELHVPFRLGDPEDFDESFFAEKVMGKLRIAPTQLKTYEPVLDLLQLGEIAGRFSYDGSLSGTAGSPNLEGHARLNEALFSGVRLDSVLMDMNYRHGQKQLEIEGRVNSAGQRLAAVSAKVPFALKLRELGVVLPTMQDSVEADIETDDFNLAALNSFADPRLLRNIAGKVNGRVVMTGTPRMPKANGAISLTSGRINVVPAAMTYTGIAGNIVFAGEEIQIPNFRMDGGSGEVTAKGSIRLNQLVPVESDIRVKANRFKLANTKDINLNVSSNAQLSGSLLQPKLDGQLTVNSGFYYLQNFGEKAVEQIQLESESEPKEELHVTLYDSLAMDFKIELDPRFSIRNRRFMDMDIAFAGGLELIKESGKEMEIFGELTADKGFVRPLGKNFVLDEGSVTYTGNPENPILDIKTKYNPPQPNDITIFYIIRGRADNPRFLYESEPEMDKKNILSYTLFGQPFYGIDSWKQVVASPDGDNSVVSDLALNVVLDRAESLATRKLGIDVVQIDNSRSGSNSSTTLRTGWYLNEKTFFAVLNELSGSTPQTEFLLEYFLQKNLKLILTQGEDNRTGVDISWQYDY